MLWRINLDRFSHNGYLPTLLSRSPLARSLATFAEAAPTDATNACRTIEIWSGYSPTHKLVHQGLPGA
jgi:hypothetical protein